MGNLIATMTTCLTFCVIFSKFITIPRTESMLWMMKHVLRFKGIRRIGIFHCLDLAPQNKKKFKFN